MTLTCIGRSISIDGVVLCFHDVETFFDMQQGYVSSFNITLDSNEAAIFLHNNTSVKVTVRCMNFTNLWFLLIIKIFSYI